MIHSDPGYLRPPSPLTAKHFSSHLPYDYASSVCYRCAITLEVARRQWENQSRLQAPGGIPPARGTIPSDLSTGNCPTSEMPDELVQLAMGQRRGWRSLHHHQQPLLLRFWSVFSRPPTPVFTNEWGDRSSVSWIRSMISDLRSNQNRATFDLLLL